MCDKAFSIIKNSKYDEYQHGLSEMFYKFFDKKTFESGIKNEMSDKQLAEELHKPMIRNFKKTKLHNKIILSRTEIFMRKSKKGIRFV